nr:MAG: hypothetical protein DIU58_10140 [Sphaerobacter thermophilus]
MNPGRTPSGFRATATSDLGDRRLLSREECEEILERAHGFARGGGETAVAIASWWQGELRWGRNRVSLSSDRRDLWVNVQRKLVNGRSVRGHIVTNQIDDASLREAVRAAERKSALGADPGWGLGDYPRLPEYPPYRGAPHWADATFNLTVKERAEVARSIIDAVEAEGLLSAGYLEVHAGATMSKGTELPELRTGEYAFWEQPYTTWTRARLTVTVRDPKGTGSGWAGLSSYDWNRIDPNALARRAIQKCIASRDPVALEPGRYTVILEPQAVADLLEPLIHQLRVGRELAERPSRHPMYLGPDEHLGIHRSKLGMKIVDSRITISHDPADPLMGLPSQTVEYPGPVTWIDHGVLTNLGHDFKTDVAALEGWHRLRGPVGYRMSGGDATIEEMIASTRRGLLVTRFSAVRTLDERSLLVTGLTRDGLWLIENGQITKAVKNFRFTESPLFALNNIEEIGEPVPVFRLGGDWVGSWIAQVSPTIVPPLKVRDFSFTSLIDAV